MRNKYLSSVKGNFQEPTYAVNKRIQLMKLFVKETSWFLEKKELHTWEASSISSSIFVKFCNIGEISSLQENHLSIHKWAPTFHDN